MSQIVVMNLKMTIKSVGGEKKRSLQWSFWMVPAGVAVRRVPYLPVKSHQSSTIHQTFAKNQPLKNLRWSGVFAGGRIRSGEVFCTCHNSKSPHSAPKSLSSISVVSITGLNLLGNCLSIPGIQDNLLGESRGRADTGNTLFEKKKSTTKVWTSSEPTHPKFVKSRQKEDKWMKWIPELEPLGKESQPCEWTILEEKPILWNVCMWMCVCSYLKWWSWFGTFS